MKHPQALNDIAYQEIKKRIMNATYKMRQPLTEEMLAEHLQISRTPIRQALRRLETEDFVEIIPYRGCIVREVTIDDIMEIYMIRAALESTCAYIATGIISSDNLEQMHKNQALALEYFEQGQYTESVQTGAQLHRMCNSLAGGRRIQRILHNLSEQVKRLDQLSSKVPGRLQCSNQQHQEIIDAITARDAKEAERLMREHVQSTCDDVIKAIRNAHSNLYYHSDGL